jgi:outer membrane protein TolC
MRVAPLIRFALPSLAVLLALAGCSDHHQDTAIHRAVVDLPPAQWPAEAPLSLRDALRLANERNERLAIEGENYLQAILDRKRAAAAFLPVVGLAGSYAVADSSAQASYSNAADAWLSGNINLFNGFRDVARMRAADLTIEQRRLLLLDLQESLLADTVRAYFAVLRGERLVGVLENTAALQETRLRDIMQRQDAGTARPLDVAQADAQASRTRVELINARRDTGAARSALELLTHAELTGASLRENDVLPPPAGDDVGALVKTAMRLRKDLLAAAAAREAARRRIDVAVGQYYPSLSLNLRAFLSRETTPTDRDWDSLLQANLPLFSAGQIEADVRDAWSEYRQSALFASLLSRQVRRDVEDAARNLKASRARQKELAVQVAAAQQALQQAEASYNAGLATNLERMTAQDQLLSAELQQWSETFNNRIYAADLLRAVGGLRQVVAPAIPEAPTSEPSATATTPTPPPSSPGPEAAP